MKSLALQNQIVTNLHTMCTDKDNFPKLNTLNFDNNEFNNGFDATLRGACSQTETGVTIRANQVVVDYPLPVYLILLFDLLQYSGTLL